MDRQNNVIYIGRNCIRYNDDIIKISNISRMYITKFYNIHKHMYQSTLSARLRNSIVAAVIFILASVLFLIQKETAMWQYIGAIFMLGAVICIIIAAFTAKNRFRKLPSKKKRFPDTHGLFIEMNSGHSVVFTAVDIAGRESLIKLQDDINNADELIEPITFNMIDNHIQVEKNQGIINLGDNAENTIKGQRE